MIVTEKQAKETWCPFVVYNAQGRLNRDDRFNVPPAQNPNIIAPSNCIASKCMAWQPVHAAQVASPGGKGSGDEPTKQDENVKQMPPRGYCGRIGLPRDS